MKKKIIKNLVWGFVPARSGSKSIKNKNILIYKKKPLLVHSLITLKKIKIVKKFFLSSDSEEYNDIAKKYINFFFHKRPKKYSQDKSTDYEVLSNFLKSKKFNYLPELIIFLRPTSPNRDEKIINKAIRKFLKNKKKFSSMRSVSFLPNPSFKTFRIIDKKLCSIFKRDFNIDKFNKPRQYFNKTYIPNGYIDIIKTEIIIKQKKIHGSKVMPFLIKDYVLDIDDINDLKKEKKIIFS